MTLHQLLQDVPVTGGIPDVEITSITGDSRQAEEGCAFFCIPGLRFDGHDHAAQAVEKGAYAVVCMRDLGLPNQVIVPDTRVALGVCCSNFFGNPTSKLKLIGITGTNGKTTITYLIKHILEQAGKTVGLIGTIHNEIGDTVLPAKYTTPDPIQLHAMFARMVEAGCEYVVMEVSSHALAQERVAGCRFAAAVFTNLTQDHLDYHGTMEEYYGAKRKLFGLCEAAVINYDDDYGKRLLEETSCQKKSFSLNQNEADYIAHNIKFTAQGSRYALMAEEKLSKVTLAMPGYFSVANSLAAIAACVSVGIPLEDAIAGIATCPGVSGRIEILPTDTPYTVIRDYAHSPDGLQKILETVREFAQGRVVILFGAAGNRDRTKRPVMGEIVSRLADFCILTSDNPRDEDPQQIVDDVLPGIKKHPTPYQVIVDRYDAIKWALENVQPDDVLVLAGKGHEDYQVLHYGTINFDEKVIVADLLNKMREADQ